jgi:hypothetical protein
MAKKTLFLARDRGVAKIIIGREPVTPEGIKSSYPPISTFGSVSGPNILYIYYII